MPRYITACGESYYSGMESREMAENYLKNNGAYKYCPWCGAKMDEEAVHDTDVNKRFMREIKELCKRKDKRS